MGGLNSAQHLNSILTVMELIICGSRERGTRNTAEDFYLVRLKLLARGSYHGGGRCLRAV
jgi:hypothetical protein